jgi:hypothetical protein
MFPLDFRAVFELVMNYGRLFLTGDFCICGEQRV